MVEEQPSKKPKKSFQNGKSDDKGAVAIVKTVHQLCRASQDSEPSELPKRMKYRGNPRRKVLGSIRRVRFTQSTLRQANIQENKGPSLGKVQVKLQHQRSPCAVKFEDRSQEETGRQERCARGDARKLAKKSKSSKSGTMLHSFRLPMSRVCRPHPQYNGRKERLLWTPKQACIWSAGKTLTLPNQVP